MIDGIQGTTMNPNARPKEHFPLPLHIGDITREWLTAALGVYFPGVTVLNSQIVDVNNGTCTKIRVRLEMDEKGKGAGIPETVILKGGFEPHSRAMSNMHRMEARAYRDVLPVLKLLSPLCYFADFEEESQQGIVIIEDLVARGVSFCHPQTPQTHEQVARRLTDLARFHARTWGGVELGPGGRWDWTHDVIASFYPHFGPFFEDGSWEKWVNSPRGAAASVRFHDKRWMADALRKLVRFTAPMPKCVLHGDTHLGNLYIDPDGSPGFFDPQPHRGPGMYEVAYHVGGALDIADRRRWEGALVRHYLDELAREGVQIPGFDDAMHQYSAFLALGYCIFLLNDTEFQTEAINTAYTARFSAAMLENHTVEILAAMS